MTWKVLSLQAIDHIVIGARNRIADMHPEIVKMVTKIMAAPERCAAVRQQCGALIENIARFGGGYSIVGVEALLGAINTGLEDEVMTVQAACARATASIYYDAIVSVQQAAQASRASANRGGSNTPEGEAASSGSVSSQASAFS